MTPPIFRLLVVTPAQTVVREQGMVRDLFEAGLSGLHLRKPGFSSDAIKTYLDFFTETERKKIVVHGADSRLISEGIAGLHCPFSELKSGTTPAGTVSTSIHNWKEYAALPPEIAYAFMGPVYNSISKSGYRQNRLAWNLPVRRPVPVIALGGIHERNAARVLDAGFSGAALLGSIWQQPEHAVVIFGAVRKQLSKARRSQDGQSVHQNNTI